MAGQPRMQQRLSQRQTQSLVMTQELQQAIKLLQMSNLELQAFIAAELEANPLLELAEPGAEEEARETAADAADTASTADAVDAADATDAADAAKAAEGAEAAAGHEADLAEAFADASSAEARMESMDMNPADVFSDDGPADAPELARAEENPAPAGGGADWTQAGGGGSRDFDDALPDFEARMASRKSLREHLLEQVGLLDLTPAQRLIAEELIGRIDADGYLREPLQPVAEQLGARAEDVEEVLEHLQTLDPAGVFARSLGECFRLQLAEAGELTPAMDMLVENLELLARRDFDKLAALCDVKPQELPEMMERLRRLDPRPGAALEADEAQSVIADVFVRAAPDGSWIVELNSETLPKVLVNNQYQAVVNASAAREQDKVFISDCLSRANWLVRSLDQRARTILAVAREMVRQQDAFLARGVHALKPLTLRQVAEALQMHESTISRVVANKYMATPRGILPFRYFFTTALAGADGEAAVSAEAVRHRIRALIENEPADKVLSDDAIVRILRREGIDIARRTVAKYREAMGIPSSVQRRREKKLLNKA